MTAASELYIETARITGVPEATVAGIRRRFVETGIWPASRGTHVAELGTKHAAYLILAILANVPTKDAHPAALAYYSLKKKDGETLGDFLVRILDGYRDLENISDISKLAYKSRLEVDCDGPRACFTTHCQDGTEQILFGVQTEQWEDVRVRRSLTISGNCLFDIAVGLHTGRWENSADLLP